MKLKPFRKLWGWVGAIGTLAGAVAIAVKTGDYTVLTLPLGAVLALFSHSATGTGGTMTNP